MAWFKVDDGLHASPKTQRAGEAMALWVMAGSWCADQLTDGWLPEHMAPRLAPRTWKRHAAKLVLAGLWVASERNGERGWVFHDWEHYQPTKVQVRAEREAAAERQKRAREKAKATRESRRDSHVSNGVSNGPPDPTRPDPKEKIKDTRSPSASTTPKSGTDDDPEFTRFWAAYPRRTGKGQARKAWATAVKTADPEVIIEAAGRFTAARGNEDPKFTPYPATWLNGERWGDAPDPRPASTTPGPVMPWELWGE